MTVISHEEFGHMSPSCVQVGVTCIGVMRVIGINLRFKIKLQPAACRAPVLESLSCVDFQELDNSLKT